MERLKVLITVKTHPIPSARYDELVCTAGVREDGSFVRLYPINFRELPFSKQYCKYQWIEVEAEKHRGRDSRKESYRPDCATLKTLGPPIPTRRGDWSERARYALARKARSMEDLRDQQERDKTSLGVIRPRAVTNLVVTPDDPAWKPAFMAALKQARLWDDRRATREPPRKLPWRFQYEFVCDDSRCTGHRLMNEDWELSALYWNLIDRGHTPKEAVEGVRKKFLGELCGADKDTHLFVGTILAHPKSWVVIGVFWPKKAGPRPAAAEAPDLFPS